MRPIFALIVLLVITAVWWALALWPLPGEAPEWLARTRSVCFGASGNGLPDAAGWIGLIGEPLGMLAVLLVVWGHDLTLDLRLLKRSTAGRSLLRFMVVLLIGAGASATARVSTLLARARAELPEPLVSTALPRVPRLDREAPYFSLLDQRGQRIGLERFRGQVVLLAFAYAHCQTVCPRTLDDLAEVQRKLGPQAPPVLLVTLDPWRDTPERLASLARQWKVDERTHVLSGSVEEVQTMLDAWQVPRGRDPKTGEVAHSRLVYVLDTRGRIAYATAEGASALVERIHALQNEPKD